MQRLDRPFPLFHRGGSRSGGTFLGATKEDHSHSQFWLNFTRRLSGESPSKARYTGLARDFRSLGALGPELELRASRVPMSYGSIELAANRPEGE